MGGKAKPKMCSMCQKVVSGAGASKHNKNVH